MSLDLPIVRGILASTLAGLDLFANFHGQVGTYRYVIALGLVLAIDDGRVFCFVPGVGDYLFPMPCLLVRLLFERHPFNNGFKLDFAIKLGKDNRVVRMAQ